MRRLTGISFSAGDGPVASGFVAFGAATVLTGRNDSGKTRLLSLLAAVLNQPREQEFVDVFAVVQAAEIDRDVAMVDEDLFDLDDIAAIADPYRQQLDVTESGDGVRLGLRLGFGRVAAWSYGRRLGDLDDVTREQLTDDLPPAAHSGDLDEPVKLGYLGEANPALLPVGVRLPAAAGAVRRDVAAAVLRLSRALQELQTVCDLLAGREVAFIDGPGEEFSRPYPRVSAADGTPAWDWLIDDDEPFEPRVHPAAVAACGAVERIAARLLPGFIVGEYRPWIRPRGPIEIARGDPVSIKLVRPDTLLGDDDDEDFAVSFELGDGPGGYELWLQLSLTEAARRTRVVSSRIEYWIRRVSHWYEAAAELDRGDEPRTWLTDLQADLSGELELTISEQDELDAIAHGLADDRSYLQQPSDQPPQTISEDDLSPELSDLEPRDLHYEPFDNDDVSAFFAVPRSSMYLIDEPEQRLHPALQRRAARWLASRLDTWGCQVILATHATAFIDLPGNRRVYELMRVHGDPDAPMRSEISPIDPSTLTPYDHLATSIGLDGGDLLTRWRLILFVDAGLAATLEEQCADRLAAIGTTLLPYDPHEPHGLLAQLRLLAQITAAPIVVLLNSSSRGAASPAGDASQLRLNAHPRDPGCVLLGTLERFKTESERHIELLALEVNPNANAAEGNTAEANTADIDRSELSQYDDPSRSGEGLAGTSTTDAQDVHGRNEWEGILSPWIADLVWRIDQLTV